MRIVLRAFGAADKVLRDCEALSARTWGGDLEHSFTEFWPEYVRAHGQAETRAVHFAGTLLGWVLLVSAVVLHRWGLFAAALVVPYGFAWTSHFFVEHNRPATFEHPLWSWWADQKMVALMLSGRMGEEVRKCQAVQSR